MPGPESSIGIEPSSHAVSLDAVTWLAQQMLELRATGYAVGKAPDTLWSTDLWRFDVGATRVTCAIPWGVMPYRPVSITTAEKYGRTYTEDLLLVCKQTDKFKNQNMLRRTPDYVCKIGVPTFYAGNDSSYQLELTKWGLYPDKTTRFTRKERKDLNRMFDDYVQEEFPNETSKRLSLKRWQQLRYLVTEALEGRARPVLAEKAQRPG